MSDFQLFIDGEYREATSGETADTIDPATGTAFATVAVAGPDDAVAAVDAAHAAYEDGRWAQLRGSQRAKVLRAVAGVIKDNAGELAELECRDAGATITKARGADVGGAAFWFRVMADYAEQLDEPEVLPQTMAPGPSYNYLRREPIGVAASIIPWNFPLQMAAWKVSTALAAGCSVVLKPALETPATAAKLGGMLKEAGVPNGVVNIIPGPGPGTGEALVTDERVAKVSFTGSTAVGRHIMKLAADTVKDVTLELGGKSAQIVLDDADLDLAIDGALYAIFFHSGQVCTAGSRLLLPDELHDQFVERLVDRVDAIRVGMPSERDVNMGPLINQKQLDRVLGYIERAREDGVTVAAGGERVTRDGLDRGYFVAPTVLTDVEPDMEIAQEEVFGPVLSVLRYRDVDHAVKLANQSVYGLAGVVWGSPGRAMKVAERLRAGTVWVNDYHLLNPRYPFGGYQQSGTGREHGWQGLLAYTETKHVHVAIDTDRQTHRWFDMTVPMATTDTASTPPGPLTTR
jgi:aldehyde dehydrogenase (NAD+)